MSSTELRILIVIKVNFVTHRISRHNFATRGKDAKTWTPQASFRKYAKKLQLGKKPFILKSVARLEVPLSATGPKKNGRGKQRRNFFERVAAQLGRLEFCFFKKIRVSSFWFSSSFGAATRRNTNMQFQRRCSLKSTQKNVSPDCTPPWKICGKICGNTAVDIRENDIDSRGAWKQGIWEFYKHAIPLAKNHSHFSKPLNGQNQYIKTSSSMTTKPSWYYTMVNNCDLSYLHFLSQHSPRALSFRRCQHKAAKSNTSMDFQGLKQHSAHTPKFDLASQKVPLAGKIEVGLFSLRLYVSHRTTNFQKLSLWNSMTNCRIVLLGHGSGECPINRRSSELPD